jgi:hypothetical protein
MRERTEIFNERVARDSNPELVGWSSRSASKERREESEKASWADSIYSFH